jgi:hypothetical protein
VFRAVRASEKKGDHYPIELGDDVYLSEYVWGKSRVARRTEMTGCWGRGQAREMGVGAMGDLTHLSLWVIWGDRYCYCMEDVCGLSP